MSKKDQIIQISADELFFQIDELIMQRKNFEVWEISMSNMSDIIETIEMAIEKNRLTCRVYTKNRMLTTAVGLFSPISAAAALTGIAIHNLATYNPDYEICRDLANGKLEVTYKK